ncbi:predicted protein [Thalassiosira pseudonana CCMP1335]|uniref:Prefoldin subunit 6 n=1 Tax=Thalassiosira pseudonana TaxID=35128 RepID=B8CEQ9_THAPS|nr:predicted protein [Thalassiosira pseudonana CCMP1335]EED87945.1 predicted protein [Thalassiosira pseudonana CCMP1335]
MYVVKEKDQLKHIPLVNVCIPQLIRFDELIQCLRSSGPCPETQYDGYFSCPLFRDSARGEYFLLFCLLSSIEGKTRSGPTAHPLDFSHIHPTTRPSTTDGTPHPIAYTNQPTASSHHHIITATMANIGSEAATVVDAKISSFRTLQEELQTHHSDLGTLMAQRNENEMVLQELEVCEGEDDAVVYKQIGPALIKNDLEDAIDTVKKRLEFINGEINKTQTLITKKEEETQQLAVQIQEMQAALQKAAVEAAKAVAAGNA